MLQEPTRAVEVPFVVFADFDCFIETQKYQKTRVGKSKVFYTETTHKHVPSGLHTTCFDETVFPGRLELYRMLQR